jgi:hypothetical protein
MAEILSYEEIKRRYDGQWVIIAHTEVDKDLEVLTGEVLAHSPNETAIYQLLSLASGRDVSIEYVGVVPENEVILKFSDSEKHMLKQISSSLALSVRVVVESAVSYVYFYTQRRGLRVEALPEYPQALGSHDFKLTIAAETIHKLEELGMTQHFSQCAIVGIHLLYNQLITNAQVKL